VAGSGMVGFVDRRAFKIDNIHAETIGSNNNFIIWEAEVSNPSEHTLELLKSINGKDFDVQATFNTYSEPYLYNYRDENYNKAIYKLRVKNKDRVIYTSRDIAISINNDVVAYPTMVNDNLNILVKDIESGKVLYAIINSL